MNSSPVGDIVCWPAIAWERYQPAGPCETFAKRDFRKSDRALDHEPTGVGATIQRAAGAAVGDGAALAAAAAARARAARPPVSGWATHRGTAAARPSVHGAAAGPLLRRTTRPN